MLLAVIMIFGCSDPFSEDSDDNGNGDPSSFQEASIIISEFMVRQDETVADPDYGEYYGWIELHNREEETVDLGGWIIAGRPLTGQTEYIHVLPEETNIQAGEYLLIWTSGRDRTGEAIHTRFTLPEDGGKIGLYGPEQAELPVIDTVSYEEPDVAADLSWGRMNFDDHDHIGFLLPMSFPTPGAENRLEQLNLRTSYPLSIADPSGLGTSYDGNNFWTISDDAGGSIYKINKQGVTTGILEVEGDDMEGITRHPENGLLYVAEERNREIVRYDTLGYEIDRFGVDVDEVNENAGLEGIAVNPENDHIYVVNEKNPRVLVELDLRQEAGQQQVRYTPMDFRAPEDAGGLDLSGLFFDAEEQVLWLVSDDAQAVLVMDRRGRPLAAYDAAREDLEGIALIKEENRIYLISDELQRMFVFDYPEPLRRLPVRERDAIQSPHSD